VGIPYERDEIRSHQTFNKKAIRMSGLFWFLRELRYNFFIPLLSPFRKRGTINLVFLETFVLLTSPVGVAFLTNGMKSGCRQTFNKKAIRKSGLFWLSFLNILQLNQTVFFT
jgi:hypothetical protein